MRCTLRQKTVNYCEKIKVAIVRYKDIKWDIQFKDAFVGFNVENERCTVAKEI